jgi:hypothetical protein
METLTLECAHKIIAAAVTKNEAATASFRNLTGNRGPERISQLQLSAFRHPDAVPEMPSPILVESRSSASSV